jgi:hypothetical protein
LWDEFEYYGIQGDAGSLKKIESRSDLLSKSAAWPAKPYLVQKRKEEDLYFGFTFRPEELNLVLRAGLTTFGQSRDRVLDQFIQFGKAIHAAFAGKAPMGPDFEILLPYLPYPRPRPPHMSAYGSTGAIVNFYSKSFMERDEDDAKGWRVLADKALPSGATRELAGDLLTIRWVQTLEDGEMLARQRSTAEIWQMENLHTPVAPGYNDLGDSRVDAFGLRPRPPMTLYDSVSKIGYKAVVRNPDGSFDRETLEQASSWLKTKALPDGTSLAKLRFILPNRESAIALHDLAESLGADAVVYMDNEKQLWNPFPPGPWIAE